MNEFLNDLEKAKIEAFCTDEAMYEAVKKVLFAVIYNDGVITDGKLNQKNGAFQLIANSYSTDGKITNEELGASLRAKFEGVHTVLDGFDKLKMVKTDIKTPFVEENEAI
jgi:hypothetical protein